MNGEGEKPRKERGNGRGNERRRKGGRRANANRRQAHDNS
jgi:hypothetical protein